MNPFQIQCTTCHRMLIVRKEAAIGQILPCPKCGSMVLIEPPKGAVNQPIQGRAAATSAESRPRSHSLDDANVDAILAAPDPQTADTVPDSEVTQPAPEVRRRTPEVVAAISTTSAVRDDWVSKETQQLKRWLMIGATAVAAAVLVIIMGGLWLSKRNPESTARPTGQRDAAADADHQAADDNQQDIDESIDGADETSAAETSSTDNSASSDSAESPETESSAGQDNDGTSTESTDDSSATSSSEPSTEAGTSNDAAASAGSDEASTAESANTGGLTAREALREFESFLTDDAFDESMRPAESAFDLIPTPTTTHDMSSALPRPTRRDINVDAQLKLRLHSVEFKDVPLSRFLQFVSDFSNLPVTIEPYALQSVGIDAGTPIHVAASDAELREILSQALDPLKLQFQMVGKHVVIIAQSTSADGFDDRRYDVFDIVGDDENEAKGMIDVITSLIAPGSWQGKGGEAEIAVSEGSLRIENTPEAHFEVMMLCERLRIARGQRPHAEVPDHVEELRPRVALALPKLAQPITASYLAPTRLTEILQYLSETSEMEMIIDWRALDDVGHSPESLAKLEANELSLSQTLQSLLGPMELSFLVLDDHTLQITSAKAAFQKPDVEVFKVTDVAAEDRGQKVLEGVRAILGEAFAGQRGPSGLRFDGRSNSLIVAAPQYQIAAIARLIEQLAAKPAATQPERPVDEPIDEDAVTP